MTDYSALIDHWKSLPQAARGDYRAIADNLKSLNTATVQGPRVDVPTSEVIGYLAMNVKLIAIQSYAGNPPDGADPKAVVVAKELVVLLTTPNLPLFRTSDPAVFAAISNLLKQLVADPASGITEDDRTALLSMSDGPILDWHKTPVDQGGAGLVGHYVNAWDLFNAGLISADDANLVELTAEAVA